MPESTPTQPHNIFLDSNFMRCPQVFDQYGPSIEGLTRDLVIWMAWNKAKQAQLNLKQFREMFGYSHAFLFKKVSLDQESWLRRKKFGQEFKDLIGYALAVLAIERLNFPEQVGYSARNDEGQRQKYKFLSVIGNDVTTTTTRRGTSYFFEVSKALLGNSEEWYKAFDLHEYLQLKAPNGSAWTAGRRMFLHLAWKRSEWERAEKEGKDTRPHESSQYDELLAVAGIRRRATDKTTSAAAAAKEAAQLREVLSDVGKFPRVNMTSEVSFNYSTGVYEVRFNKLNLELKTANKVGRPRKDK